MVVQLGSRTLSSPDESSVTKFEAFNFISVCSSEAAGLRADIQCLIAKSGSFAYHMDTKRGVRNGSS